MLRKSKVDSNVVNKREDEKIGEIKEKKHVLKQSSAQSANDFLWAHFVAPLEIEEDVTVEEDSTMGGGGDDEDDENAGEMDGRKSSSTTPKSPDKPTSPKARGSRRKTTATGGGVLRKSFRRSSSSSSTGSLRIKVPQSDRISTRAVPTNRKSFKGRGSGIAIKLKQKSPSPIPTPPPLPCPELTVRTIDGNFVKIGLRPHDGSVERSADYYAPLDHVTHIVSPARLKGLNLDDPGPEKAYGPSDKEDIFKILREKFPWFRLLDYDGQEEVIDAIKTRAYRRDQYIYRQGDDPDGMYFVERGTVDIIHTRGGQRDDEDSVSLLLASLGADEFFGETECQEMPDESSSLPLRYASALVGSETVRVLFLPMSAVIKHLLPNEKVKDGFKLHLELYKDQLLQFGIKDLGELIPKKQEKATGATKSTAAEYLWGHYYEEIGAKDGKPLSRPLIPRPVNRGGEFLAHLFKLWMENRCCDATIKLGYHRFPLHSLILKLFCQNYNKLCSVDDPKTVMLEGLTPKSVLETMYYLYTTRVVLTTTNVANILRCALSLGIPSLVQMCKHFIDAYLKPDDVLKVSRSLHELKSLSLDSRLKRLLGESFDHVIAAEDFKTLSPEMILKFLTHPDLRVDSEAQVLRGVITWLNADRATRLPLAPKLVSQCVKFEEITPAEILKETLPNPHIFEGEECRVIVLKAITYHALHPGISGPSTPDPVHASNKFSRVKGMADGSPDHGITLMDKDEIDPEDLFDDTPKNSISFERKKSIMNLDLKRDSKSGKQELRDQRSLERAHVDLSNLEIEAKAIIPTNEAFKRPRKSIKPPDATRDKEQQAAKVLEKPRTLADVEKADRDLKKRHAENQEVLRKNEQERKDIILKGSKPEPAPAREAEAKATTTAKQAEKEASGTNELTSRLNRLKKVDKVSKDGK